MCRSHRPATQPSEHLTSTSSRTGSSARRHLPRTPRRIREELRALDPKQPVTAIRSMSEVKARAMATETFQMTLLTVLASIGLLLAAAGIYGLVAYSVAQRTREFGIRLALGASRRILVSVMRQGTILSVIGVLVGGVMAAAVMRTLRSFVFGVSPARSRNARRRRRRSDRRRRDRECGAGCAGASPQSGRGAPADLTHATRTELERDELIAETNRLFLRYLRVR